jgi:hypothetical protein
MGEILAETQAAPTRQETFSTSYRLAPLRDTLSISSSSPLGARCRRVEDGTTMAKLCAAQTSETGSGIQDSLNFTNDLKLIAKMLTNIVLICYYYHVVNDKHQFEKEN